MNPSMASKRQDDRTCRREQRKSRQIGFSKYYKGNILDIMETNPDQIPQDPALARTNRNLAAVRTMAERSDWIILAYGSMPPIFAEAVTETLEVLYNSGTPIACFNRNPDSHPTHTRRLLNNAIPDQLQDLVNIRQMYAP
jgi:hypothetical protein